MHSSVTSEFASSGRSARSVRVERRRLGLPHQRAARDGSQLINRPEIQISARPAPGCDRPLCLTTVGGMLEVPLSTSVMTSCVADGLTMTVPSAVRGLHGRLDGPVDGRDQHGGAEALPEVAVYLAGQPGAPQLIGAGRGQRHDHAGGRTRLGPQHEYARLPLLHLAAVSPTNLVPRSSSTTLPSTPKVSVAVMQVVIPGSVESMAVSKVQSMNAPWAAASAVSAGLGARGSSDRCGTQQCCQRPDGAADTLAGGDRRRRGLISRRRDTRARLRIRKHRAGQPALQCQFRRRSLVRGAV